MESINVFMNSLLSWGAQAAFIYIAILVIRQQEIRQFLGRKGTSGVLAIVALTVAMLVYSINSRSLPPELFDIYRWGVVATLAFVGGYNVGEHFANALKAKKETK